MIEIVYFYLIVGVLVYVIAFSFSSDVRNNATSNQIAMLIMSILIWPMIVAGAIAGLCKHP